MTPTVKPWKFFLSYAHADADGLLKGFADDLSAVVERRLRISAPAGFLDQNDILVGMDWSDRLGEALRTSLVLVCLISKAYLRSEGCGRELEVFLRRRALLLAGANPEVILPVFWERPAMIAAQMPGSLTTFQYSDTSLPESYRNLGAKAVLLDREIDSDREDDPYRRLLAALSRKIAFAAESGLPEIAVEQMPAFAALPNAFLPSAPHAPAAPASSASNSRGMFEPNFVFAIPAAGEFPQGTPQEGYSDNGGWYWQPFRGIDEGIGQLVSQARTPFRPHEHTDGDVETNLVDELIAKGKQDQLVILLVDPFAVLNPRYLEFFRKFDDSVVPNSAVIAVGADDDFEDKLTQAFPNSYPRLKGTPYFRCGVSAKETLLQTLRATLDQLIDNIKKRRLSVIRIPGLELRHLTPPGRAA